MKPIASAIPGQLSLEKMDESSTGDERGKTGLQTQLSDQLPARSEKPSAQHPEVIQRPPKQNLEAAASQLRELGLSLKQEVTGSKFPEGGDWEPIVELKFSDRDDCDWHGVQTVVNELMAPAPVEQIVEWLTVLAMETASKDEGEAISKLRLKVLSERLTEYPGDVVRVVLREWPLSQTFFPNAFKPLSDALNARMGNRRKIVMKLNHAIKQQSTKGLSDLPMGIDPENQMKRNLKIARQKAKVMGVKVKDDNEKEQGA